MNLHTFSIPSQQFSDLERRASWNAIYHNRQTQLGNTATLINFGDTDNFGALTASTGTGMKYHASGLSPVWTPSEAISAFDTPGVQWQGVIPCVTFNGTDEWMNTPDAAGWSTAGAFSIGAWIYLNTLTNNMILSKWDDTTGVEAREFQMGVDSTGDIIMLVYDETNNAQVGRKQQTALVAGQWYFVVGTFSGGTDAADVSIGVNGVLTDDANVTDDAGFANAVDTATVVQLGYFENAAGAKATLFDGKIAGGPCCPFFVQAELTVEQIFNMYRLERLALNV